MTESNPTRTGLLQWLSLGVFQFRPYLTMAFAVLLAGSVYSSTEIQYVGQEVPAGRGVGHWERFSSVEGLADRGVWSLYQDRSGNIWAGTLGDGVIRYNGKTARVFTTDDGLADDQVWDVFEDRDGVIWFATWGGGISRYDGTDFQTIDSSSGLTDNFVRRILQDQNGVLWDMQVRWADVEHPDDRRRASGQRSDGAQSGRPRKDLGGH